MNPLSLLRLLGGPQIPLLDPLLQASFALGTGMQKAGLLPSSPYKPAAGGPASPTRPSSRIGNLPPGYRESELAAGAAAETFRPGAGFPGQQTNTFASVGTPVERAEKQERSRVAQMTEQDPLFKKYRVAELTKAYNTASPEDKEKIGLEIWATTNPQLAQKLKPGQTGYSEAVTAFQSQGPLGALTKAAGGMQYADLSQQPSTASVGPGVILSGFSPAQLQTPLTGVAIPPTNKIGVNEFFSDIKPASGSMEAFTDPLRLFSPEKLDETKRALLIQAFNKNLK
jgi:hypothetical protein